MGKVKELWEEERHKRFKELTDHRLAQGYTQIEAEDMAIDEMEKEDAANGQFGVGA